MTTDDIKLIRLTNGSDLLSFLIEVGPGIYQLHDPIEVVFNNQTGRELIMMDSWMPVQIVPKTSVMILARDVLFISPVEGPIINNYLQMVGKLRASKMPPAIPSNQPPVEASSNVAPTITSNTEVKATETTEEDDDSSLKGRFGFMLLSQWDPEGETPQ